MANSKSQSRFLIVLAVLATLAVVFAGGLFFGAKALKGKVEQALGPEADIGLSENVSPSADGRENGNF